MSLPSRRLLIPAVMFLSSCATPSPTHTELAFTTRVVERQEVSATPAGPSKQGIYRPGMGGAVGGLVAGLLSGPSGATPAYWGYTFKMSDGSTRYAPSLVEYQVGDCLSVFTEPAKASTVAVEHDAKPFLRADVPKAASRLLAHRSPRTLGPRKDAMPLVTLTVRRPKSSAFKATVLDAVHSALVASGVPASDLFQRVIELDAEDFRFDLSYPDVKTTRTSDFALVEILWSAGRSVKVKRKVLEELMATLAGAGFDIENVMVCFKETSWENWSFAGGRLIHT